MDIDWGKVKHFGASEFRNAEKMNPELIYALDRFRAIVGKPVVIHSSYREGDRGQHGMGNAVDVHVKGMNVLDQYLLAEKCGLFNGIGIYIGWSNKGLHLDVREKPARWGCDSAGAYCALDSDFIRKVVDAI